MMKASKESVHEKDGEKEKKTHHIRSEWTGTTTDRTTDRTTDTPTDVNIHQYSHYVDVSDFVQSYLSCVRVQGQEAWIKAQYRTEPLAPPLGLWLCFQNICR